MIKVLCLMLGLAFGCGHPARQPDQEPYDSTVLVPISYFPVPAESFREEMKTLTVRVMNLDSSGFGAVSVPQWMEGSWRIEGASEFRTAVISRKKIEFHSPSRDKAKTGYPFLDPEFLILGAGISPSGRLLAFHEGLPKAADADSLYAGYIEITRRESDSKKVEEWSFTERNVGYGIGLIQSDREHWTFIRINP